ncbi:spaetzle domain-containing protein 6 [Brevipalpus obovatus]|uniref:spaetzle domain-containing protein 6 n=1 Tax=Brevipalpus obovatus TaxID=246614 RepID=UPI003D9DB533
MKSIVKIFSVFLKFISLILLVCPLSRGADIPPGYFAFEKASRIHGVPPRVRKPPYLLVNVPCHGAIKSDLRMAPKDNLCGDLNRGFVPLNPMLQQLDGQPYPFELIKNKTLHFLARSLPFLKQDISNIPKVAKLPSPESNTIDHQVDGHQLPVASSYVNRENNKFDFHNTNNNNNNNNHNDNLQTPSHQPPIHIHSPHHHIIQKRSLANLTSRFRAEIMRREGFPFGMNLTEARQKVCEQNEGMVCQVMQALTGGQGSGGFLNALSQGVQVVSAASNAANTAHSISSLVSLLQQLSSAGNGATGSSSGGSSSSSSSSGGSGSNSGSSSGGSSSSSSSDTAGGTTQKSTLSQVISLLASLNTPSSTGTSTNNNNFSPLGAIVDYIMTVNPSTISSLMPARRKKPLDLEDLASETVTVAQVPPTPCPSVEEYVAPVYARNYQGVWKYVVQIPNEGYFTQTVQKTSCMNRRCDFLDGVCHESPRWVSLLVAEVFYPQPKFPNLIATGSEMKPIHAMVSQMKPQYGPMNNHLGTGIPQSYHHHLGPMGPMSPIGHLMPVRPNNHAAALGVNDFHHHPVDQYLSRKGLMKEEPNSLAKPRFVHRTARMYNGEDDVNNGNNKKQHPLNQKKKEEDDASQSSPNGSSPPASSSSSSSSSPAVECDGHDNIGCYQMRVYYDWFLIPGACKCWKKTSSQSGLDTLKKIFIGK